MTRPASVDLLLDERARVLTQRNEALTDLGHAAVLLAQFERLSADLIGTDARSSSALTTLTDQTRLFLNELDR